MLVADPHGLTVSSKTRSLCTARQPLLHPPGSEGPGGAATHRSCMTASEKQKCSTFCARSPRWQHQLSSRSTPQWQGKKKIKSFLRKKKKDIPVTTKSQLHRSHLGVSDAACPHTLRQACEEQRAANRCGQRADSTERPQKQPARASTGPGPRSAPPRSLLLCCCEEQTRVQTSCTTHSFLRV